MKDKISRIAFIVGVLVILAGLGTYAWHLHFGNSVSVGGGNELSSMIESQPSDLNDTVKGVEEEDNVGQLGSEVVFSDEELFETNNWLQQNGFSFEFTSAGPARAASPTTYHELSIDELRDLADGDEFAEVVLAEKLFLRKEYDAARQHLLNAAVRGYVKPLINLAEIEGMEAKQLFAAGDAGAANKKLRSHYAWQRIYSHIHFNDNMKFDHRYAKVFPDAIRQTALTASEQEAKTLLRELTAQRYELGYGEFESSMPAVVKEITQSRVNNR